MSKRNHLTTTSILIVLLLISNPFFHSLAQSSLKKHETQNPFLDLPNENLKRSMALVDKTILAYFNPNTFEMSRYYNPFTQVKSEETASVWMYTAGIEAVNAILSALKSNKENADQNLYKLNYPKYEKLLAKLYENLDYYLGTFELVSFTQTKTWSVYAVDRVREKGKANVTGVLNVYDDQMWLLRELIHSYKLTGNKEYLKKAEYLTAYVLDGWDPSIDENGKDRVHAAETLAKLRISPLKDYPDITQRAMEAGNKSLSLYTRWSNCYVSLDSLISVRDTFFELMLSKKENVTYKSLAAYVIRQLDKLDKEQWNLLAQSALSEPEDSDIRLHLLNAAFVCVDKESIQSDLFKQVYKEFLKYRNMADNNIRIKLADGLAENGHPEDIMLLSSFLKINDSSVDPISADLRAFVSYAILRICNRWKLN